MSSSLPQNPAERLDLSWSELEAFTQDLLDRSLDEQSLPSWLMEWSDLSRLVYEVRERLYVAITVNTTDAKAEELYNRFLDGLYPAFRAADQQLKEKLLTSRLEPEGFTVPLLNLRTEAAIFRQENLPLLSEELRLSTDYFKLIGAQTITWEGKEVTLSQLQPVYLEVDRERRERAWHLEMERRLRDRPAINDQWYKLLELRGKLAANAGMPDYRTYRWQQMLRFDYTPEDCYRFHDAIEQIIVPVARRIYERRRQRLGLTELRPWDLWVDPFGRPPMRPYSSARELIEKTSAIFHRVDPALGAYFDIMRNENLLDLENRKGKAPGGYCTSFEVVKRPFIFMNGVGLHEDVLTLLHEGGHAFHVFEAARLPYIQQQHVGMEFGEVASMAMELLSSPYLVNSQGGFYTEQEAARARIEHLEQAILFWPYMAVVDAFQHWAYENPAAAAVPANCDATWDALWGRFMPGVDWSGLDEARRTGWQRKMHIFEVPFYYVEYGMAQLGAFQIWRNALNDQAAAVSAYRRALALGGTVSLPQLYTTAGIRFAFDIDTLKRSVELGESKISELEEVQ